MAKEVASVYIGIRGDTSKLASDISRTTSTIVGAVSEVGTKVGTALSAALTAPIVAGGAAAIKAASDFETMSQKVTGALRGNKQAGDEWMKSLEEMANNAGIPMEDLVDSFARLATSSGNGDQAMQQLEQLANIAAGAGGNITQMADAWAKSNDSANLSVKTFEAFARNNVNLADELYAKAAEANNGWFTVANQLKEAKEDLAVFIKDFKEFGKISPDDFNAQLPAKEAKVASLEGPNAQAVALKEALSAGVLPANALNEALEKLAANKFADGIAMQLDTLDGKMQQLKNNSQSALKEIGKSIEEAFDLKGKTDTGISALQEFTTWWTSLDKPIQTAVIGTVAFVAILGPLAVAIGLVAAAFLALNVSMGPILLIMGAVVAVGALIALMFVDLDSKSGFVAGIGEMIRRQFGEKAYAAFNKFIDVLKIVKDVILHPIDSIEKLLGKLKELWNWVADHTFNILFGDAGVSTASASTGSPKFASGGSFDVGGHGGTDSQFVAFRASPGEHVSVSTPSQMAFAGSEGGMGGISANVTLNVASGVSKADMAALIPQLQKSFINALQVQLKNGGGLAKRIRG